MAKHRSGEISLARIEVGQRALEVRADDRLRVAEALEGRKTECGRAFGPLLLPQTAQHELEVGGFDATCVLYVVDPTRAACTEIDPADAGLLEHRLDQLRLDLDVFAREPVVALDRAENRRAGRGTIELLETKVVGEEPGNARLELIEKARQGVVACGEEDRHAQTRLRDQYRKRVGEGPRPRLVSVVEEELLETVEDEQNVDVAMLGSDAAARPAARHQNRRCEARQELRPAGQGIGPPRMEDDDCVLGRAVRADAAAAGVRRRPAAVSSCRRRSARRTTVSLDARTFATINVRSRSRPKNNSASRSDALKGARPLNGVVGTSTIPPPGHARAAGD